MKKFLAFTGMVIVLIGVLSACQSSAEAVTEAAANTNTSANTEPSANNDAAGPNAGPEGALNAITTASLRTARIVSATLDVVGPVEIVDIAVLAILGLALLRGVFHYLTFYPGGQASHFVSTVGNRIPELGFWGDIEDKAAPECRHMPRLKIAGNPFRPNPKGIKDIVSQYT